jgi:hypothetical protein
MDTGAFPAMIVRDAPFAMIFWLTPRPDSSPAAASRPRMNIHGLDSFIVINGHTSAKPCIANRDTGPAAILIELTNRLGGG